ncbi:MAG: phosphate ABC transporter substrate-binding protein PstS, partial [Phormidium sp.]
MSVRVQLKRRNLLVFLCLSAFFVASIASNHLHSQSATANDSSLLLAQGGVRLTGAGASFPAPLYQRWFSEFNKSNPNLQISYQSVGSGAGVQQLINGTVDFGASDVAMTDGEMAKVSRGVVLIPMTAGSVVAGYNLPGVTSLKLSRSTLPAIFLGQIKTWNDPKIAKDNPGVKLPNRPISVVYRADGSGTTAVFTKHLSAI